MSAAPEQPSEAVLESVRGWLIFANSARHMGNLRQNPTESAYAALTAAEQAYILEDFQ